MINVLVVTSGRTRMRMAADVVTARASEFDMTVSTVDRLPGTIVQHGADRVAHVRIPRDTNVLVLPQPAGPDAVNALRCLRHDMPHLGIVVDLTHSPDDNEQLLRVCAIVDVLTTSCQVLAGFYERYERESFVIRDAVPSSVLSHPSRPLSRDRKDDMRDRVIGWTGDPIRAQDDLQATCGALREVVGVDRTDGRRVTFRNIGPYDGLARTLMLHPCDVEASGRLPLDLHRTALGELDVAIAPVSEISDYATRSALRVLEFAAAGVPVIASSTFEHRTLRDMGMPLWLVKEEKDEWLRALRAMMAYDDVELRNVAGQHRENVRRHHTIERRAAQWAHAWRTAARILEKEHV